MKMPPLVITILTDVLGQPYVTIEGDPERMDNIRDIAPIRMTLWAEDVRIEDMRK